MKVKKFLAMMLSLTLVMTSFTSVSALSGATRVTAPEDVAIMLFNGDSIEADVRVENLDDETELRVIVELKEKPVIEYATQKGIKVSKLEKNLLKSITKNLKDSQEQVKEKIKKDGIKIKYHHSFVTVANGFSATTTLANAKKIEKMTGVERVVIANEYDRPEPELVSSGNMVNASQTWDLGYNGEGMIISIIDSGVDPSHKDMRLSTPNNAALTQQGTAELIATKSMVGKWYTSKVPYGYNYYDNNDIILDLTPDGIMHGMHVTGIAGANGNDATGIKGIAPEAQILAMKVFSNDPNYGSTYGDIYMAAIEDTIILGADVLNMSLGSTGSFARPNDPEQLALTRASENGIIYSGSSGNSGHIGYGLTALPYAKNPDIGVVGAPGLNANSIQVASIENTHTYEDALKYKDGTIAYMSAGNPGPHPFGILNGPIEYVNCKLGLVGTTTAGIAIDDFEGVDVKGKIALIQRGGYTGITGNFTDKILNAEKQGALGVIVYNNASGGDALMSMLYPETKGIPAVFISLSDGNKLMSLIGTPDGKVEFSSDKKLAFNPIGGKMAESSSWGTTPNLELKPEITAPGAKIYSTLNNSTYGAMSGTSMAAPHVAGGSALILQRVDKEFDLTGAARNAMAKNLLLSTAEPLADKGTYNTAYNAGNFTSPRRQGAGVMNLQAAATTPAVVVDKSTEISKVNLREIGNVSKFTLKVKNFSDSVVEYNVSGTVGTDLVLSARNRAETQGVYRSGTTQEQSPWAGEFPISFTKNNQPVSVIAVPAKGEVEFDVTVDLTNTEVWADGKSLDATFPNGTFIEGFVRLTSDTVPAIGVPYMGFYGKWDKAPILDDTNYNPTRVPYYGYLTTLAWLDGTTYRFLGAPLVGQQDATKIAFSPNDDGKADKARLMATFLRNAKELEINILSKEGEQLRTITKEYELRKNFYNNGKGSTYKANASWEWDGKINNKPAAEGQYIYQVKTIVDYPNAEWQIVEFPIVIDNAAPILDKVSYDKVTNQLTVLAIDNHAIKQYDITREGAPTVSNSTGIFDLESYEQGTYSFTVKVHDFALNTIEQTAEVVISNDAELPVIYVESPIVMEVYNTDTIIAKGYVTDNTELKEFKVNGIVVATTYDATAKVYNFQQELKLPDGGQRIRFEAVDIAGNVMSIDRKIFIDTKAPVINVTLPEVVGFEVDKVDISGTVTDNMPGLKVYIRGNMVYNSNTSWLYVDGEVPVSYEIKDYNVNLAVGENTIIIEATDDAGFVTVKEFKIVRKEKEIPLTIDDMTVTPKEKVSISNPVKITATANQQADWEVVIKNSKGVVVQTYKKTATTVFEASWAPANESKLNGTYTVEVKAIMGSETVSKLAGSFVVNNKDVKKNN